MLAQAPGAARIGFHFLSSGTHEGVASTRPAPRPDRTSRMSLAALTAGGVLMLLWLIASLAQAAFGG